MQPRARLNEFGFANRSGVRRLRVLSAFRWLTPECTSGCPSRGRHRTQYRKRHPRQRQRIGESRRESRRPLSMP